MPKIVAYLRVSTDEQAESGLGLEAQLSACRAAADRLGLPIASIHEDDGVSGGKGIDQRPGLVGAIAELTAGDVLLVMKRDRIARGDPVMVAMIEGAVRKQGAKLVSAAGEGTEDDSPGSILFRRMIDAFNEYELLLIRARTRAALRAKLDRGERRGSVPYGLRVDPAHPARSRKSGRPCGLVPDPAEVAILGSIRRWKAEGMSLRSIARRLDAEGIATKGGRPWSHSTVAALLKRTPDHEPIEEPIHAEADHD